MWTLANSMAEEWQPRTVLRTERQSAEADEDEGVIAFRNGRPTPLMQVLLDALSPFPDARRAVADALKRFAGPYPAASP